MRLKISTEEFEQRYKAGEFKNRQEETEVRSVLSLLPLISPMGAVSCSSQSSKNHNASPDSSE